MKRVFSCILACLLLTAFCIFNVAAASTEAVASVHFDAYINTDGTVDVTETWNVEYSGTGEGFTRWIDIYDSSNSNNLSDLQKFDEITNVAVKINGVQISESSNGVDSFKSGKSSDGKSFDIVINSPSAVTTKEYTISYTVTGAVKKQGNDVRFAFVFIGNAFRYTCNNVTASVYAPQEVAGENIVVNGETEALISENAVQFTAGRVYDTFGVDISVPDDAFDTQSLVSYSAFKNLLKSFGQALLQALYIIIAVAAAAAVVILALFYEKMKRFSIEKKARKNTDDAPDSLPEGTTACKAYKMLVPYSRVNPKSTTGKVPHLFAMAVLECIEKGYIVQKESDLIIGTPNGDEDAYIMSALNFLKTFSEKKLNRYIISSDFGERVKAECMSNYDSISNYLGTFYTLVPDIDSKFFKDEANLRIYEQSYILKTSVRKEKQKYSFSRCIQSVLAGAKTSDKEIFALMFAGNTVFDASGNDAAAALAQAVGAMYDVFVNSK